MPLDEAGTSQNPPDLHLYVALYSLSQGLQLLSL